jgi:hypothetical protein
MIPIIVFIVSLIFIVLFLIPALNFFTSLIQKLGINGLIIALVVGGISFGLGHLIGKWWDIVAAVLVTSVTVILLTGTYKEVQPTLIFLLKSLFLFGLCKLGLFLGGRFSSGWENYGLALGFLIAVAILKLGKSK